MFSAVIYHISGINFDKSIVVDILVGLISLENLQPEKNDHCLGSKDNQVCQSRATGKIFFWEAWLTIPSTTKGIVFWLKS